MNINCLYEYFDTSLVNEHTTDQFVIIRNYQWPVGILINRLMVTRRCGLATILR